ncbi:hypothetical protein ABPG72_016444 [Tetrahymena utriculariae]
MSDFEDIQPTQSPQKQLKIETHIDPKAQDYKIQKAQSANTSFSSGEDYQNTEQVRRIKSDNYYYQNDYQSSYIYKHNQNNNNYNNSSRFQQDKWQSNHQYSNDQQRRKNWRQNKFNNFSNSINQPPAFSKFMNYQISQNISTFPNDLTNNQLNIFNVQNNGGISQLNLLNPIFPTLQSNPSKIPYPPQPGQPPKNNLFQQLSQNQLGNSSLNQLSSLKILQNINQAEGSLINNQQYQGIRKNSGGMGVLLNSSSQCSTKELDNQIQQQLDSYKEDYMNRNYYSWASILNQNFNQNYLLDFEQKNDTIQTDYYNQQLQIQLEESVAKLDKGSLVHYQVDISEQDNCSPFEYLKQFKKESKSLREDYLDLMANLDSYTEKLYDAIQAKATEHLKKNNYNLSTLLQNNNVNNYHPNSQQSYQQQQQMIQNQRNNAKQIIKGAVQNVLEYSETRTVVPRYARDGDWLCQCGNLNFQHRNTCNKCLIMKPKYQYTQNAEITQQLDQFEKQLMNIDSTIAPAPTQDEFISIQRQIILNDFIWVCKCCRTINYSKSSMCNSCKMYKYIDRSKLLEITKKSQSKLCKYAFKMQERHKHYLENLKASKLPLNEEEGNQEASSKKELLSSQQMSEESFQQLNDKNIFDSALNSQSIQTTSSLSSSDEASLIHNSLQNSQIEDLNKTHLQISLNNSQNQITLNLSTDSDTKQNQSQNLEGKQKDSIFILDQLDKSCDADNSSSDSLEFDMQEHYSNKINSGIKKEKSNKVNCSKKQTPESKMKSIIKTSVKSAKSRKKSSKIKEFCFLQELNEEPQKKLKQNYEQIPISDNDKTILDETIAESDEKHEEKVYEIIVEDSQEKDKNLNLIPNQMELDSEKQNQQQILSKQIQNDIQNCIQNENQRTDLDNAELKTGEQNQIQNESQHEFTFKAQLENSSLQEINEFCSQNNSDQQQSQIAEEESLLMGLDDKDFLDGYFS